MTAHKHYVKISKIKFYLYMQGNKKGRKVMARFKITFQKIQNGKIVSTAGTSVDASSIMEAKNKFNATHIPSNSYKYKIVSCVKI